MHGVSRGVVLPCYHQGNGVRMMWHRWRGCPAQTDTTLCVADARVSHELDEREAVEYAHGVHLTNANQTNMHMADMHLTNAKQKNMHMAGS